MKKSTFFTTILAMLLGIVLGVFSIPAFAVDGGATDELGLFELDGNPQDTIDAGPFPEDWETLWIDCGKFLINPYDPEVDGGPCGGSDKFTGVVADAEGQTIFTGGGSKDIYDISRGPGEKGSVWLHDSGSEPDKNDIINAFTAAYQLDGDGSEWCAYVDNDPTLLRPVVVEIIACDDASYPDPPAGLDAEFLHRENDTIIYFGADRLTNNGDAFLGFWFFQEKVELTNVSQQGGLKFKGKHKQGDALVLVEFPQGSGAVPLVKVYVWDFDETGLPNVDEDGHSIGPLEMIFNSTDDATVSALCDGTGGKLACAVTNPEDLVLGSLVPAGEDDGLWPYRPKGGAQDDDYPHETFYSGGINISRLIGEGRCFSSFMAESRSSRSETAQLKDFVLGSFPLCNASSETKIHAGSNAAGTPHTEIALNSFVAVVGDTIHDSVLITGEILGSGTAPDPGVDGDTPVTDVTFTLYDNLTCDAGEADANVLNTSTGTLTGNGDGTSSAESNNFTLTKIGTHSYQASWAGDSNYPGGALSGCEPFNVIQPKLKVVKAVNTCLSSASTDQGTFDLLYKRTSTPTTNFIKVATAVGDGGNSGFFGVNPGTYAVDETMINKPGEYVRRFQPSGDCVGGTVTLAGNQQKTCTIENIRKPHLIVKKQIVGSPPDSGLFNLRIKNVTENSVETVDSGNVPTDTSYISGDGSDVGNGAVVRIRIDDGPLTGSPASFGTFIISETAGTTTDLANYQTTILCDDTNTTQAVFASTETGSRATAAIPLKAGFVVTCTITNVVKPTVNDCPVQ